MQNFANDLELISDTIRSRTVSQIKGALQKKAYDAAGIVVQPQQIVHNPTPIQNSVTQISTSSAPKQNADVTLAALNASESEVDVEDMGTPTDSSLDFWFNDTWKDPRNIFGINSQQDFKLFERLNLSKSEMSE